MNRLDFAVTCEEETGDKVYFENAVNNGSQLHNADAVAMTAWVRTKPLDLGNADAIKEIEALRVGLRLVDGSPNQVQYRIGVQEDEDDAITWGSYTYISGGFDLDEIRTSGRYITIEIYSDDNNIAWQLSALDVYGIISGDR